MYPDYPFRGKFDIIFCRNVMIYFDKEKQSELLHKMYNYLYPDGYFFVGHSESFFGIKTDFKKADTAVFRK